jgi:hypothetical protein
MSVVRAPSAPLRAGSSQSTRRTGHPRSWWDKQLKAGASQFFEDVDLQLWSFSQLISRRVARFGLFISQSGTGCPVPSAPWRFVETPLCKRSWFPPFANRAKNGAPVAVGKTNKLNDAPPANLSCSDVGTERMGHPPNTGLEWATRLERTQANCCSVIFAFTVASIPRGRATVDSSAS